MKNWVISDIHGCCQTFEALLDAIGLNKEDNLFLLGDYIDRGPRSKQVLDLIMKLEKEQYNIRYLMGNHEIMMLYALKHPRSFPAYDWRNVHGGLNTLQSFNARTLNDIDEKYIQFIKNMDVYLEFEKFILVHAGLNLKLDDPFSDQDAMLWHDNGNFIEPTEWLGNRVIVHGHTIQPKSQIMQSIIQLEIFPILGIDNGCVYSYEEYNHLCAVELSTLELKFQKNIDI